jgi:hypothetical protein
MREDALAWCAFFLMPLNGQASASQSNVYVRGAHARQIHLHDYNVFHLAKVNGRKPSSGHTGHVRLRCLLQGFKETANAVAQSFKLKALKTSRVHGFDHLDSYLSWALLRHARRACV